MDPIAYAHVGVTAVDSAATADAPEWAAGRWPNRSGNESRVSQPAAIFRVNRQVPSAPMASEEPARHNATPADRNGVSHYTYRWPKPGAMPGLKTHVFRALDEAIFAADWEARAVDYWIDPNDETIFPLSLRGAAPQSLLRRQEIATELDQLNNFARTTNGRVQALAHARNLADDTLQVLAGRPEVLRAFRQLTVAPLDEGAAENQDRIGPDGPSNYVPIASLCAFADKLPGRGNNRYFYRCAYVDAANNRGELGLSSPPVYLPKVVPPRPPVWTRAIPGDRTITLRWSSNREGDLAEYRLYRASNEREARDVRLMTLVAAIPPSHAEPPQRPAEELHEDLVVAGVTYRYRLVAVDDSGNVSEASPSLAARAYDLTAPEHPTWTPATPDPGSGELVLLWTSPDIALKCLVQRSAAGSGVWSPLGGWLARGTYSTTDRTRLPGTTYDYRLRVNDAEGRGNRNYLIFTV